MSLSSNFVGFVCLLIFFKWLHEHAILPKEIGPRGQDVCWNFLYSVLAPSNIGNTWPLQRHLRRPLRRSRVVLAVALL